MWERRAGGRRRCEGLTEEGMMPVVFLVRIRQLFLVLILALHFLGWETNLSVSFAQESILDQGPMPDTVKKLQSPLDLPFVPLAPYPWLLTALRDAVHDRLDPHLQQMEPFFRDTQVTLNTRMYYFNHDKNPVGKDDVYNEAWTVGGSLAYQSGWLRDFFSLGAQVFTSQKLYGPLDRDGTLLLRERQQEYTVVGRFYGQFKYENYLATVYRQFLDLPYVNQQDNRMTPNTFEAYRVAGKYRWLQFVVGYVDKMKSRNSSTFISMSQAAGAPADRKRGLLMAGARLTPSDDFNIGAINYYVPDVFNIAYAETNYTRPITDELGLKLQAQFTDQRDVGGDKFLGSFNTQVVSSQAALSYKNVIFRSGFSSTATGAAIQSPYGTYPGYLNLIEEPFDRAGETAWLLGLSYDCKRFITGLNLDLNYAHGFSARNPTTNQALPDESEFDLTVDYRIQAGRLSGFWIRVREAYVNFDQNGGSQNNVRLSLNHELPIL